MKILRKFFKRFNTCKRYKEAPETALKCGGPPLTLLELQNSDRNRRQSVFSLESQDREKTLNAMFPTCYRQSICPSPTSSSHSYLSENTVSSFSSPQLAKTSLDAKDKRKDQLSLLTNATLPLTGYDEIFSQIETYPLPTHRSNWRNRSSRRTRANSRQHIQCYPETINKSSFNMQENSSQHIHCQLETINKPSLNMQENSSQYVQCQPETINKSSPKTQKNPSQSVQFQPETMEKGCQTDELYDPVYYEFGFLDNNPTTADADSNTHVNDHGACKPEEVRSDAKDRDILLQARCSIPRVKPICLKSPFRKIRKRPYSKPTYAAPEYSQWCMGSPRMRNVTNKRNGFENRSFNYFYRNLMLYNSFSNMSYV